MEQRSDRSETVNLGRLLDALNSVDEQTRKVVVAALREHAPKTYWFIGLNGRVTVG